MSGQIDFRSHEWHRQRRWNADELTLGVIGDDNTVTKIITINEEWRLYETKGEGDSEMGKSEVVYEFRISEFAGVKRAQIELANVLLFAGDRYEVDRRQWKKNEPRHWQLLTKLTGPDED